MDTASVTSSLGLWINPNFIYEAKMELKVLNKWKAENKHKFLSSPSIPPH